MSVILMKFGIGSLLHVKLAMAQPRHCLLPKFLTGAFGVRRFFEAAGAIASIGFQRGTYLLNVDMVWIECGFHEYVLQKTDVIFSNVPSGLRRNIFWLVVG